VQTDLTFFNSFAAEAAFTSPESPIGNADASAAPPAVTPDRLKKARRSNELPTNPAKAFVNRGPFATPPLFFVSIMFSPYLKTSFKIVLIHSKSLHDPSLDSLHDLLFSYFFALAGLSLTTIAAPATAPTTPAVFKNSLLGRTFLLTFDI
jgi:hypothetical protein